MVVFDVARMVIAIGVVAFAAVCDLEWRRAPDVCWLVVAGAGAFLLAVEWVLTPSFWVVYRPSLLTSLLVVALAVGGYLTGLIAGGADAKALASLAVLAPLPLVGWSLPLSSPFPLVLTALTNGLLIALVVPLVLVVWNLARGDISGARTFLGFRTGLDRVKQRVVWPLEYVDEEGALVVASSPRGMPRDAFDAEALRALGRERVWVTPKVPFLVPLWLGLVGAVLVGDPLAWALDALLV